MTNKPRQIPHMLRRHGARAFQRLSQKFAHRSILNRAISESDAVEFFQKAIRSRIGSPLKRSAVGRAERSLPADPISGALEDLPNIDIAITAHQKDFTWLPLVVETALTNSLNPIAAVRIISPPGPIPNLPDGITVQFELESELLGSEAMRRIAAIAPPGRIGWILQQVIKFYACLTADAPATLVIDADTVLLYPKAWLSSDGRQALSPSMEYHRPYVLQAESHWGDLGSPHGVSFVTHHQLLQKEIVAEMFPRGLDSILEWVSRIDPVEQSAISEYHSYGTFLSNAHPDRIAWARWANAVAFDITADSISMNHLRRKFPWAQSVSFHSYLNE